MWFLDKTTAVTKINVLLETSKPTKFDVAGTISEAETICPGKSDHSINKDVNTKETVNMEGKLEESEVWCFSWTLNCTDLYVDVVNNFGL